MNFVIVTGLSGAGKTQAVRCMEDLGFFCVDNIPPEMILKFAEIYYRSSGNQKKAAIVTDTRGGEMFNALSKSLKSLSENGYDYQILFLEANTEILIKRYKETRRRHPLDHSGRIEEAISKERDILKSVRNKANYIIDTSNFRSNQLIKHINSIFSADGKMDGFLVNIVSFGYKYGIPLDADLMFDVRFLPNPFYVPELKKHSGEESVVSLYVMSFEQSREFLKRLCELLEYLLPHYIEEGKSQLIIAIGCTGGRHRSVTIAAELCKYLKIHGSKVIITHRDVDKR